MPEDHGRDARTTDAPLHIAVPTEDRYASLRLIRWWDQERLGRATVVVAGAGALGNEVIKNLALLGVGRIVIVDFDRVEVSNLARSVLFRDEDIGRPKAEAAADGVARLNPEVEAFPIVGDVRRHVGFGVFRRADAVLGCFDNREARLALNRATYRFGKPWVDGALNALLGESRLFWPGRGACYECTMTPRDYDLIAARYSCQTLRRESFKEPRVPTTPTIAAIIGAIQVQDALKILHGLEVQCGKAFVFNGLTNESYATDLPFNELCLSHDTYAPVVEREDLGADTSIRELLQIGSTLLNEPATLELDADFLVRLECTCGRGTEDVLRLGLDVTDRLLPCPSCGADRLPDLTHRITGDEPFADRPLSALGVRPLDVVVLRGARRRCFVELTGDLVRLAFMSERGDRHNPRRDHQPDNHLDQHRHQDRPRHAASGAAAE